MTRWAVFLLTIGAAASARANHGPGTSGGGAATISGETLKEGMFDISYRMDFTQFEHFNTEQAEQQAIHSGGFDALKWGLINSTSLAYGVTNDLQVSATIGVYNGHDFIDAEATGPMTAESGTANPSGLTDLWTNVKYRVMQSKVGNLSLIGGVKFPVGKDDVRLSNGELVEPSSQPGTGAFDFQGGLAFSRFLTSQLTFDASAVFTYRTQENDFRVGNRFDGDLALAYRLTEDIKVYPNYSVFGEILTVWLARDLDSGDDNPNSGGTTVYLSPGLRVRVDPTISTTMAVAFPVIQDLNGDQDKTRYKVSFGVSFSF